MPWFLAVVPLIIAAMFLVLGVTAGVQGFKYSRDKVFSPGERLFIGTFWPLVSLFCLSMAAIGFYLVINFCGVFPCG
jgi:hypothetical protein